MKLYFSDIHYNASGVIQKCIQLQSNRKPATSDLNREREMFLAHLLCLLVSIFLTSQPHQQ